jgi:murein DD-endopeptidase MepM/ murein hydrolase activator NlpD
MAGGQNYTSPTDGADGTPKVNQDALFQDLPKELLRLFKDVESYVDRIAKKYGKMIKETTDAVKGVENKDDKPGGSRLGLAPMSPAAKVGLGVAVGTQAFMGMAPNTMAAVTQRLAADSYASMSGMSSRQAILQANKQVGGGATSAMGPTMAAMNLAYGGYTANSLSSKNIMGQLAGLSAQSGMSNEAAAASVGGMNGMMFLRAGIRIRDNNGNLKPIDQIINQVYNFLYRGRQISSEEAQLVYNTGSRSYSTIAQLAGGDPNLIQQIQAGIVARTRAKSGKAYSAAMNSKDPNKMLDLMGVDKSSPTRSQFRFNSSETRKLAATEQGLVGGYNVALRTTASVNDGFSTMAGLLGPINEGLMTLKGILQTLPGAGNTGATLTGLGSAATSLGGSAIQARMLGNMFGGKGTGFSGGGSMPGFLGKFGKGVGVLGKGSMLGKAGRVGLAAGIYAGGEWLQKFLNKKGKNLPSWARKLGNFAFDLGEGALTGLAAGGLQGAVAGTVAGGVGDILGGGVGGPNDYGNLGTAGVALSTSPGDTPKVYPTPAGTKITSPFGPRRADDHGRAGFHHGLDLGVKSGTDVRAFKDGHVSYIGNEAKGYGNYIEIKHDDGTATRYGHLRQVLVTRGQKVKAGQVIAKSGGNASDPGHGDSIHQHLHFEVLKNGQKVDPLPYLTGSSDKSIGYIKNTSKNSGVRSFLSGSYNPNQKIVPVSPGALSSAPLASLLSQVSASGEPLSWQDVVKKLPKKDVKKYIDSLPDSYKGPVTSDKKSLIRTISQQGFHGKALRTAYAISIAESGGRSNAVGDVGLQDSKWGPSIGLFQIRSLKHWQQYNDPYRDASRLPNPNYNAQAAWAKSSNGRSFKAWSTYTSGSFLKHLSEADTMAKQVGVGGPAAGVNLPSNFSPAGAMNNQSITISGGRSGTGNVTVNLHMNVKIAHGSVQETDRLVRLIGEKLKNDHTLKQIASTL